MKICWRQYWQPFAVIMFFCFVLLWLWQNSTLNYDWQWYRLWRFVGRFGENGFRAGPLLEGLGVTLSIIALSFVCTACIGLGTALLRLLPWPVGRMFATLLVGVVRNTPLLIQLFMVYFLLAPVFHLGPFGSAVLALSFFEGVYVAEILRAGCLSVPRQQWESAMSLGFSPLHAFWLIIFPQALRAVFPALTGQGVALIKDSALVSAITVTDLTMRSQMIIADTFMTFEVWLFAAALYLALTSLAVLAAYGVRQRWLNTA